MLIVGKTRFTERGLTVMTDSNATQTINYPTHNNSHRLSPHRTQLKHSRFHLRIFKVISEILTVGETRFTERQLTLTTDSNATQASELLHTQQRPSTYTPLNTIEAFKVSFT